MTSHKLNWLQNFIFQNCYLKDIYQLKHWSTGRQNYKEICEVQIEGSIFYIKWNHKTTVFQRKIRNWKSIDLPLLDLSWAQLTSNFYWHSCMSSIEVRRGHAEVSQWTINFSFEYIFLSNTVVWCFQLIYVHYA